MTKKADYISTAFEIGATLCRNAIWHGNRCNWIDLKFNESTQKFYHGPLPVDLYEGTAGIALFLYNLYSVTNEKIFKTTAAGALHNAYEQRNNAQPSLINSFYLGKAGVAYVLLKAYEVTGEKEWKAKALEIFDEIGQADAHAMRHDIISGTAGLIPVFVYGSVLLKDKQLMQKAISFADVLIEKAIVQDQCLSWNYNNEFEKAHTGFGHGSSGMGYAFMLLYHYLKQEKYLKAAIESFNYDDSFFNSSYNGWQRLNDSSTMNGDRGEWQEYPSMWCYGTAGIGIAKLFAWLITKDAAHKNFLMNAISRTSEYNKFEINFGLCHGYSGNCELLLTAGRLMKNKNWIAEAEATADRGIERISSLNHEWQCGGRGNYQTYAFMNGIAGIGNFYLRLTDSKIPSGLFLEELL